MLGRFQLVFHCCTARCSQMFRFLGDVVLESFDMAYEGNIFFKNIKVKAVKDNISAKMFASLDLDSPVYRLYQEMLF